MSGVDDNVVGEDGMKLWGSDDEELYADDEEEGEGGMGVEQGGVSGGGGGAAAGGAAGAATDAAASGEEKMFLPGMALPKDTELTVDSSAYITLNEWTTEWPCLSFGVVGDGLGDSRSTFPMTAYMVAGTQAPTPEQNALVLMKVTDIPQTTRDEEEDEDEDDEEHPPAKMQHQIVKHHGAVNRVQVCPHNSAIVSTWSETGQVHLWDLSPQIAALDAPTTAAGKGRAAGGGGGSRSNSVPGKPAFTFDGHQDEGYAMGWSPVVPYRMATGDNTAKIHVWDRREDGSFHVSPTPCAAHTDSVEDIQWSPSEKNVFTSGSADGTLRVWDIRTAMRYVRACAHASGRRCFAKADGRVAIWRWGQSGGRLGVHFRLVVSTSQTNLDDVIRCAITVQAHDVDVNSVSWNRCEQHLMASGADDGSFRIWDLRTFGAKKIEPVAHWKWHSAPVTCVEWHPTDASVLCASGEDDQISIWDLAVEQDAEAAGSSGGGAMDGTGEREVPPQLLFVHQGQKNVKEAHWHKQLPGVVISTAESGFNLFKTISVTH